MTAPQPQVSRCCDPIPPERLTWSVPTDDNDTSRITYGDFHELMHRDISIGNTYRIERIKHLITLAAAILALTITFHKDLFGGELTPIAFVLMLLAWISLLASLWAGAEHLRRWEDFYLAHRAVANALWSYRVAGQDTGRQAAATARYNKARQEVDSLAVDFRRWNARQTRTLLFGILMLIVYATVAFAMQDGAAPAAPPAAAATAPDARPEPGKAAGPAAAPEQ